MHETFHYHSLEDIRKAAETEGAWLPMREDIAALLQPLALPNGRWVQNRLALQPMEGTDGTGDGAPGPLTIRRYLRFASGGAGVIWFEAVATAPEARASARQLYLTEENVSAYQALVDQIKEAGLRATGHAPLLIMQATHSGRYSKPQGAPAPIIAYNNPLFETNTPIDPSRIVTDDALRRYEACYTQTARLAQRAGFDGMDVKACHRYLACELLSAYLRPGPYGGSFENRARFLLGCFQAAKAGITGDFFLTSRLNVYDGYPYPYGFGVSQGGGLEPDLSEPKALIRLLLEEYGLPLINITIGNPYTNPHVNRPYDRGNYVPPEHPLVGISRMMRCVSEIQHAFPALPVLGSAFTYLRQFSPFLAAGMLEGGHASLAGYGRMAFANPDFPRQLRERGMIDETQTCICCGQCAALLRQGKPAGCVVRDRDVYQLSGDAE